MIERFKAKPAEGPLPSCTTAARRYFQERGWKPLPVAKGKKGPEGQGATGWPEWQVGGDIDSYMKEHFTGMVLPNVAIQMGAMSGGLTDVDLDCAEAVRLAAGFEFLPPTTAVYGRTSKRRSHHFYVTSLYETETRATLQFKESKELDPSEAMLVELRIGGGGKGACSMVPPSLHKSGELISWDEEGAATAVEGAELKECVATLAAASMLVRRYPPDGARHTAALVLGGVLARAGWEEKDIAWFVGAVAQVAGDEESADRARSAADAVALLAEGKDTPGLPRMRAEWGGALTDLFAEWIGYANGASAKAGQSGGDDEQDTVVRKQTDQLVELAARVELYHNAAEVA
jgi:hypothetical protein